MVRLTASLRQHAVGWHRLSLHNRIFIVYLGGGNIFEKCLLSSHNLSNSWDYFLK